MASCLGGLAARDQQHDSSYQRDAANDGWHRNGFVLLRRCLERPHLQNLPVLGVSNSLKHQSDYSNNDEDYPRDGTGFHLFFA